jgi:hypothetical protein
MDSFKRVLGGGDYLTVLIDRDRKSSHCIFLDLRWSSRFLLCLVHLLQYSTAKSARRGSSHFNTPDF